MEFDILEVVPIPVAGFGMDGNQTIRAKSADESLQIRYRRVARGVIYDQRNAGLPECIRQSFCAGLVEVAWPQRPDGDPMGQHPGAHQFRHRRRWEQQDHVASVLGQPLRKDPTLPDRVDSIEFLAPLDEDPLVIGDVDLEAGKAWFGDRVSADGMDQ